MKNQWLVIKFKNSDIAHYSPSEYTDYEYDGKCFIVIKDKQWIGIYNMDVVACVNVTTMEEAEGKKGMYS